MNKQALYHRGKSNMAYALDENTLNIWFQTAKDDVDSVSIIAGDPFIWVPRNDGSGSFEWSHSSSESGKMAKKYSSDLFDYYFISYNPPCKRTKYSFLVQADGKEYLYGASEMYELTSESDPRKFNLFNYFNFPCINPSDVIDTPKWVKDTIWYQIFPDRFCNGDPSINPIDVSPWDITAKVSNHMIFGGDIKGIISKLDYLQDLGITGIYFNPIFEAISTHKYDTTNYYKIDPIFGSNDDFKELVQECHKRDIHIMLDAVFNHCGWNHPYFQDVIKNGKNSPYYHCFNIRREPMINFELDENGLPKYNFKTDFKAPNFDTFAFTPYMPKWNTDNEITREYLLDVTRYWMDYGIDGWRLDVSNEVSHEFWRLFKRVVREKNPNALILGENWDDSTPWLSGDQMDAVMNYGLLYPIYEFFGKDKYTPRIDALNFTYLINRLIVRYPYTIACNMFNLVGCHDTNRILNMCGENKDLERLCFVFLFSFTGTPNIYYGDEIGLTGGGDPDNRRLMIWDPKKQDLEMKEFFKKMITLRKKHDSFKDPDITWLLSADNILVYQKESIHERTIFILNNNDEAKEIELDELRGAYINLYTSEELVLKSKITLKPYQFMILK